MNGQRRLSADSKKLTRFKNEAQASGHQLGAAYLAKMHSICRAAIYSAPDGTAFSCGTAPPPVEVERP
jgi:hypothetical protein